MRLALTVVSPATRQIADVILDADPATPVGQIAAELDRFASGGIARALDDPAQDSTGPGGEDPPVPRPGRAGLDGRVRTRPQTRSWTTPLYVDYQLVPPGLSLAQSSLRDGSVISLGGPEGCVYPEPTGLVEIRVAGGPGAGRGAPAGPRRDQRRQRAERSPSGWHDPQVPEFALHLTVDRRGDCQVTAYAGVRATSEGEPLTAPVRWQPGQQIAVGATLLGLAPYEPPDAALHPSEDGAGIDFNRPPRLLPPERVTRFQLPSAARPPSERRPLPVLMAVVPVVLGVAMACLHARDLHARHVRAEPGHADRQPHVSERKHGRKILLPQRMAEYREHKARIERRRAGRARRGAGRPPRGLPRPRHHACRSPPGPRRRLWERRRTDPDYLLLRVGTADLPSAVELTDPEQDEHRRQVFWQIPDAPVTMPLRERGVVGVAGPGDTPRAPRPLARGPGGQPAQPQRPADLRAH